jgi:sigma-E factor negative regulatory protein RseA
MTDPIHEQLSAFLDGELSSAESELLLKRVERDPQLKVLLERYVLAGEALRATAVQARPSREFAARVSAGIASDSAPGRARLHIAQWLKPVAGGAIAAGVAAVALVSLQTTSQVSTPMATTQVAQETAREASSAQMTNQNASSFVVPTNEHRVTPPFQVAVNGRLANFVVAHSEYSSPLGRRNVLTGLVAEEVALGQPEQMPLYEEIAPTPKAEATKQPMISRGPR